MLFRRRSSKRVQWYNDAARCLDARAQPRRGDPTQAEPALGRRATVPGDAANRHCSLAVRRLQRVPAGHTRTQRDASSRASAH